MESVKEWWLTQYNQNVWGYSPPPRFIWWKDLARAMKWDALSTADKQSKRDRYLRVFDDETALMFKTFDKLIGTLTPAGLIFGIIGGGLLHAKLTFLGGLFVVWASLAIILVLWGLSTRFKVMSPITDTSLDDLVVRDGLGGKGEIIEDELAAWVWYYYLWRWHRKCTRQSIDRIFLWACLVLAGTLTLVAVQATILLA